MTELHLPEGMMEWAKTQVVPSEWFGGTRGESWSPDDTASLLEGTWTLNEGMTLLRRLMALRSEDDDALLTQVITEVADWLADVTMWVKICVSDQAKPETDKGEALIETQSNLKFLSDSLVEQVNRVTYAKQS